MKIAIDAHCLGAHAGGNETYVRELLHALGEHVPDADVTAYVSKEFHAANDRVAGFPTYPLAVSLSYVRVPVAIPMAVRRTRPDLVHLQYTAPPHCPCPFVVGIHDIVWKRRPELLQPLTRRRLEWLTPSTLRRAARVFALTNAIKLEIADAYHVPAERIDVVAPAPDPRFQPLDDPQRLAAVRAKYGLPDEFILYLGALQPRKNLARLAKAFHRLIERGFPHALVIAGPRIWLYEQVLAELAALGLGERLKLLEYVETEHVPPLINAASAFAYLSLYEGFGLPVIEALACGVPVLTSTDPAICEVAGEAALTCDPIDLDAIQHGLETILADTALRGRLRQAGPLRAAQFTRERMARAAWAGYEKALA